MRSRVHGHLLVHGMPRRQVQDRNWKCAVHRLWSWNILNNSGRRVCVELSRVSDWFQLADYKRGSYCLYLQRRVHRTERRTVHRLCCWKVQDGQWQFRMYRLSRQHISNFTTARLYFGTESSISLHVSTGLGCWQFPLHGREWECPSWGADCWQGYCCKCYRKRCRTVYVLRRRDDSNANTVACRFNTHDIYDMQHYEVSGWDIEKDFRWSWIQLAARSLEWVCRVYILQRSRKPAIRYKSKH
jgi:hypothetical protein